jgi:hypothetical protein
LIILLILVLIFFIELKLFRILVDILIMIFTFIRRLDELRSALELTELINLFFLSIDNIVREELFGLFFFLLS